MRQNVKALNEEAVRLVIASYRAIAMHWPSPTPASRYSDADGSEVRVRDVLTMPASLSASLEPSPKILSMRVT